MGRIYAGRAASVRLFLVVGLCLGVLLLAGILGLASVGAAGLITDTRAPHGWDQLSDAFSVVNGIFSVFALIVVGATLWVQFNELRMQRAELRMQREATEQSQRELRRSSEAVLRELHVHITELAIKDPDLAEVYSRYGPGVPPRLRKQYFYANLVLNYYNLVFRSGDRDEAYFRIMLAGEFENPLIRGFWAEVRELRQAVRLPGTPEGAFDALCEEAYQAAVAAAAGGRDGAG
ncbi:DUF6082 family protein [Dactylosporangium sp. NPDC048998]|uniref:DUF6082 family protein n=1 Tax=Dactylosporangium sp. NPDC048998 TaxID=3363976 RepID=UPI00371845AC